MCKKTGTWTTKLYELARRAEYGEAGGYAQDVRVLIEGPYGKKPTTIIRLVFNSIPIFMLILIPILVGWTGGPGHMMLASFAGALIVAGGSGITFGLGAFQELVQKDLEGESRLKAIELVWSVPDPGKRVDLYVVLSIGADNMT